MINRVRQGKFDIGEYALDRTTRILLPLIPACILTVTISWTIFNQKPNWWQAIFNIVGLGGIFVDTLDRNAPLWTLTYEIWFYIMAGAVGFVFGRRQGAPIAVIVIAMGTGVFSILAARYALFWFLGAMCVLIPPQERVWHFGVSGGVLSILGIVAYQLSLESDAYQTIVLLPGPVARELSLIRGLFAYNLCVRPDGGLSNRPIAKAGGLSRLDILYNVFVSCAARCGVGASVSES